MVFEICTIPKQYRRTRIRLHYHLITYAYHKFLTHKVDIEHFGQTLAPFRLEHKDIDR